MNRNNIICLEIRTTNNLIKRELDKSSFKDYVDKLTCMNGWVIAYLFDHADRDVYQKDIEETFSIRRSTVSKILKLMEEKGLIKREKVYHDARLNKLVLTDKATEIHKLAVKNMEETEKKVRAGLTQEEIDRFCNIAKKIQKNLESE